MSDVDKAEKILRGECLECGMTLQHKMSCSHNINNRITMKLNSIEDKIDTIYGTATRIANEYPDEVSQYLEDKKKDV